MTQYFRIKPFFSVIAHSENTVEFRSGVFNHVGFTVQDESQSNELLRFIELLDGKNSVSDIRKTLQISNSSAEKIIDHLNQYGILEEKPTSAFDYYSEIYIPHFKTYLESEDMVINKKITIIALSELSNQVKENLIKYTPLKNITYSEDQQIISILKDKDLDWLHHALHFEEILERFSYLKDHFVVLAFDHIEPIISKKFAKIAYELNINWIHAATDGPLLFIGPLFEKNSTACYECFESRVTINLREYNSYQKYKTALVRNHIVKQAKFPLTSMLNHLLISHLNLEIMNYCLTQCSFLKNKVLSIYLPTMEISFNEFIRVSGCEICGSQVNRDDCQVYFEVSHLLEE